MIIIGSYAAKLLGDLPPWRGGKIGDIDLVGTLTEYDALLARVGKHSIHVASSLRHSPMKKTISFLGMSPSIEFDAIGRESSRLLAALPDNASREAFGSPVLVASVCTLWVLKVACRHIPVQRQKHEADIWWFEHLMAIRGVTPSAEHHRLLEVCREENTVYFSHKEYIECQHQI